MEEKQKSTLLTIVVVKGTCYNCNGIVWPLRMGTCTIFSVENRSWAHLYLHYMLFIYILSTAQ